MLDSTLEIIFFQYFKGNSTLCSSFQYCCRDDQGHSNYCGVCVCTCALMCVLVLVFFSGKCRFIFISRVLKCHDDVLWCEFILVVSRALWIWKSKSFTSEVFGVFHLWFCPFVFFVLSFWNSYCLDVGFPTLVLYFSDSFSPTVHLSVCSSFREISLTLPSDIFITFLLLYF